MFSSLQDYIYVGFGSTFFIDFKLIHQRYGMRRLFSIERETRLKPRFELNRPLDCVQMLYGPSKSRLLDPRIPWADFPAIVWLDYDEPLDLEKLADCERVLTRAAHGTLLLVTVAANAGKRPGRADRWRSTLGDWVPYEENDSTLDTERIAELSFDVLTEHAEEALEAPRPEWRFEQLFRMRYRDSAEMATWGGILLDRGKPGKTSDCGFRQLPYVVRKGRPTYRLEVPNLTPIERALVESRLPGRKRGARALLRKHAVPEDEVDRLAAVYRYAPRFVETFA